MTEGLLVSAHRAQGQHPSEGCCPPGGWVRPRKPCAMPAHSNPPARRDPEPSWPVGFVAQDTALNIHWKSPILVNLLSSPSHNSYYDQYGEKHIHFHTRL